MQYTHCTGDPRSVNSLTSPVSTFKKNTAMRLSIQFLTEAPTIIYVYQAVLGNVDVLLATFNYPETVPANATDNSKSNFLAVFDVCLPAGTYSVMFVAKAVCNTIACSQPSFDFLDFSATEDSDVCYSAVHNSSYNSSAGIKQLHVV